MHKIRYSTYVYIISSSSSGFNGRNLALIRVNDVPVYLDKNENDNDRGLHIVVINANNGRIDSAKVFDTYTTSEEFELFISS